MALTSSWGWGEGERWAVLGAPVDWRDSDGAQLPPAARGWRYCMRTSHRRSNRPEEKTATRFQKTLRRYTPIKRRNTPIPRRLGATRIEKETRFGHQRNRPLSARYGDAQANVRKNGRRRDETVDGPTDGVDGVLVWGWGAQGIFKIAKLYANTTNRTPPYRAEARQEGFLQGRKKGGAGRDTKLGASVGASPRSPTP